MDKIGAYTGTADSNGEFTEGDPTAGVEATIVEDGWLNAIQREVVELIKSMGLSLDTADDALVWQAVRKIYGRTNAGNPNGTLSAHVLRERVWDTSKSPPVLYVATAADGTVSGTTWTAMFPHATFAATQYLTTDADGVLVLEDY